MNSNQHPDCFGTMFPDVLHPVNDKPHRGKVFSILLERAGGLFRSNREIAADVTEWDKCRDCPAFDACYKFSMAKLTLASAIITE